MFIRIPSALFRYIKSQTVYTKLNSNYCAAYMFAGSLEMSSNVTGTVAFASGSHYLRASSHVSTLFQQMMLHMMWWFLGEKRMRANCFSSLLILFSPTLVQGVLLRIILVFSCSLRKGFLVLISAIFGVSGSLSSKKSLPTVLQIPAISNFKRTFHVLSTLLAPKKKKIPTEQENEMNFDNKTSVLSNTTQILV